MATVKEIKDGISKLEKTISLRQIALRSGINYITLRNIKLGKSSRVTDGVAKRFKNFTTAFDPAAESLNPVRRGRKPKAAAKAAPAPKATPAPKAAPAPKAKRRRRLGRPRLKPSPAPAPTVSSTRSPLLDSQKLAAEILETQARLDYLKVLQKAQQDYFRLIGNKG